MQLVDFVNKNKGKFMAGFITYEFGAKELNVPPHNLTGNLPAAHFRVYDTFLKNSNKGISHSSTWEEFTPIISQKKYNADFYKIKSYIIEGEFYQVNYTHPLKSKTDSPPRKLFQSFRSRNKVGYSVFFENDSWVIHCLSPEQFIIINNRTVLTQPIKGTILRGNTLESDENNLKTLLTNEKEQAELYMIIDLLRNDLGKVCKTGSVKVLKSKAVRKLEKVFHTYGVIEGKLKKEIQPIEALLSMSPGGSISGCPKKRACEVIHEMEKYSRGIYTGTIGYILPDGTLNFNIAIRTVVQMGNELTLGVGGGITIGSNNNDEYKETLAKAASFQP